MDGDCMDSIVHGNHFYGTVDAVFCVWDDRFFCGVSVSRKDDGCWGSAGRHPVRNGFADKGLDDDPYYAFV